MVVNHLTGTIYVQVVNHGVEGRVMSEMMEVTKAFFDLPWEEKSVYDKSPVKFGTSLNSPYAHVCNWRDYLHFVDPFHMWPSSPPNYKYYT